jgi:adenine-specific DNA-methyltransferase
MEPTVRKVPSRALTAHLVGAWLTTRTVASVHEPSGDNHVEPSDTEAGEHGEHGNGGSGQPANWHVVAEAAADGAGGDHEFFVGDNLDVLAHLSDEIDRGVRPRFDLAYLDPPYNTRRALRYQDQRGKRGRHEDWVDFVEPRLRAVAEVLAPGGLCAVSIDARELAHLWLVCDEVFGESNRLAHIVQKVKAPAGLGGGCIVDVCEHLLVYTTDASVWRGRRLVRHEPMTRQGEYRRKITGIDGGEVIAVVGEREADGSPELGGVVVRRHRATIVRAGAEVLAGDIAGVFCTTNAQGVARLAPHVPKKGVYSATYTTRDGVRTRWFLDGRVMAFLSDTARTENSVTVKQTRETNLWDENWHQGLGAEGGVRFPDGKKPLAMLQRIASWFGPDVRVLDPFAGSGSTLEAVARLNVIDGGTRQVVLATSDEAGIPDEVTWPRVTGVVAGRRPDGRPGSGTGGRVVRYAKV